MNVFLSIPFLCFSTLATAAMMKDTYFKVHEGGMSRYIGKISAMAAKDDGKSALIEACSALHGKKVCKKSLEVKVLSLKTSDYPRYKGDKEEIWKVTDVVMEGSLKNSPFVRNSISSYKLTPGNTTCTSKDYWYGGYKKEGFIAYFSQSYEVEFGVIALDEKGQEVPGSEWTVSSSHDIYKHWRTYSPAKSRKRFNDPSEFATVCEELKLDQEKAFEKEVEKHIEAINVKTPIVQIIPFAHLIMAGKLY